MTFTNQSKTDALIPQHTSPTWKKMAKISQNWLKELNFQRKEAQFLVNLASHIKWYETDASTTSQLHTSVAILNTYISEELAPLIQAVQQHHDNLSRAKKGAIFLDEKSCLETQQQLEKIMTASRQGFHKIKTELFQPVENVLANLPVSFY